MTLVEAEAYGTPALICDPDMQEIMPRGGYILSRDESPAAMAEAIRQILDQPEKIQKMSEVMLKNRKEVLISKRIEILEQILRKIMRKNHH